MLAGYSYPDNVDGEIVLDTSRRGNRNTGPGFSNRQRAAIIEFLKTL